MCVCVSDWLLGLLCVCGNLVVKTERLMFCFVLLLLLNFFF